MISLLIIPLLSKVFDINNFQDERNPDLQKISQLSFQWKMHFNPDPNKQVNENIFSRKPSTLPHPLLKFNNDFSKCSHQKYLGTVIDSKVGFSIHIEKKLSVIK